jgi:hypothetical protein
MDRNAGLSSQRKGAIAAPQFRPGSFSEPLQLPFDCFVFSTPFKWESNVKLITLAAIAAFTATPVLAQTIQGEARADYHQAQADAERAQMQKENAQAEANNAAADAATSRAQSNVAQTDANDLQARANEAQSKADLAKNQANASQAEANTAQSQVDQAKADRDAALDRAAQARKTIKNY